MNNKKTIARVGNFIVTKENGNGMDWVSIKAVSGFWTMRFRQDNMMFRPLAFDFPEDKMAQQVEDQLLLGNELMIAPIYHQNAQGRYVYLPEEMMLVRMKSHDHYETEILPQGHHYVAAALDELVEGVSVPAE